MLEFFVLSGPDAGRSCGLKSGDVIGRAESSALRLNDRSVSRRHAEVELRGGQLVLVDLDSTNGLQVDGERVGEVRLVDFLEFQVGEVLIRARLIEASSEQISLLDPEPKAETFEPEVQFAFGGGAKISTQEAAPEPEIEIEWDQGEPEPPARKAPVGLREEQRAALLEGLQSKRGGVLSADLSQYPGWIQVLVGALILGLGVGLSYGVYLLVVGVRG